MTRKDSNSLFLDKIDQILYSDTNEAPVHHIHNIEPKHVKAASKDSTRASGLESDHKSYHHSKFSIPTKRINSLLPSSLIRTQILSRIYGNPQDTTAQRY